MIVIRVELWPHGFEAGKRPLGLMRIFNDGTGTVERGNYIAHKLQRHCPNVARDHRFTSRATIKDHLRAYPVWKLLQKALNAKWRAA